MKSILIPVVVCLVLLVSVSARAVRVRHLNLADMTLSAKYVFAGECVGKETVFDADIGRDIYVYTFRVDRVVKGNPGGSHEVRVIKSLADQNQISNFEKGENLVLFLYGESRLGFSSPVGLGQGRFRVKTLDNGRQEIVNDIQNRGLFRGMKTAVRERALSSPGGAEIPDEGPMDYEIFMALTEDLVNR